MVRNPQEQPGPKPQGRQLPRLIVLSGPAGVGKNTVAERLCRETGIRRAITATTRVPRPGEVDGRDYFFLTEEQFRRRVERDELLEHATVHGRLYGTPRRQVEEAMAAGESCLLVIDVQGAEQVRQQRPDALLIFLDAPDEATQTERLAGRSTEDAGERERRLATAAVERQHKDRYDCCVVNDDLDRTVAELRAVVTSDRRPQHRRQRLNG